MTREDLSARENWQTESSAVGQDAEQSARKILSAYLMRDEVLEMIERPKHLRFIYASTYGIEPDFAVHSRITNKVAFFEVKRQGILGNAHERACKYFAPGIERAASKIAGFDRPFFFIFMDGLATDTKKRLEIASWFDVPDYQDRFLLWEDREPPSLIAFFEESVRKYLL